MRSPIRVTRLLFVCGAVALATTAACMQDFDQFFQGQETGGGGGTGNTGNTGGSGNSGNTGGGGGQPGCTGPNECPGNDTTCSYRTCDAGECGMANASSGTSCTEDGGQVCDGDGSCVECVDVAQCDAQTEDCQNNHCVPLTCLNQEQDGDETDVDCGGPDCAPCANDLLCLEARDCLSQFCDATASPATCQPCSNHNDCTPVADTWCDPTVNEGSCVDQKAPGDACGDDRECLDGHCPADDGVCCLTACDGLCEACLQAKTGTANGTCDLVTGDTDPDTECAADDPSTCDSDGSGCTGTDNTCNLYDSSTVCVPGTCTGSTLTGARHCDGDGTCLAAGGTSSCAPYTCNAAGDDCRADCSDQSHCTTGNYCDGNDCLDKKADGDDCTNGYECEHDNCPADDLVCCDDACDGECEACLNSKTGAGDGNCAAVPAGEDPDTECTADPPCGLTGDCNGSSSAPACETATCASCVDMYQGNTGVLAICGDTIDECALRVDTRGTGVTCPDICHNGGGDCLRYYNDTNNQCTLTGTGDCGATQTHDSAMCICTHYCGTHPPCPDGQTCNGTDCV